MIFGFIIGFIIGVGAMFVFVCGFFIKDLGSTEIMYSKDRGEESEIKKIVAEKLFEFNHLQN